MKRKLLLFLLATAYCYVQISAQTLDPKFVSADGRVNAVLQSGDSVYIGGDFHTLGIGVKGIARFKPGNTNPDPGFPQLDGNSGAQAITSDENGGFYLSGFFNSFNGNPIEPTAVIHILANGSLDPNFGKVDDNQSYSIHALKKKGNKLYIGGGFNFIQGVQRQYLVALNAATGALDNWKPDAPNSYVYAIDANDSLLFIQGSFNFVGSNYQPNNFAALKIKDGRVETNFPTANSNIRCFEVADNKLYLGGSFYNLGYRKQGLAKISASNTELNSTFPSTTGTVRCILPDGKGGFYIGGNFTKVGDYGRNNLAHILPSGKVDPTFYVNVDGDIYNLASDSSNLYICGYFTSVNGAPRSHAASVSLVSGTVTNFNPVANNTIYTIAVHKGTVYMGGSFTTMKGKSRNYVAAVTTSNTLTSWAPNPDNAVYKLIVNGTGSSVFLGGEFTYVKNQLYPHLVKVNTTNGNPYSWRPNPDQTVFSMALDKNILYLKGNFSSINSTYRQFFAAVDTSSTQPTPLQANIGNYYYSYSFNGLSVNNGKLYIAGAFTSIQDSIRSNIARIDLATGLVDNWNSGNTINPNNDIEAVCASGNAVVIGGGFDFLSIATRNQLAAIDLSNYKIDSWNPDIPNYSGSILGILHYNNTVFVCGSFQYNTTKNSGVYMYNLVALNDVTGKISHQFAQYANGTIRSMCIYDNKLMVGGEFSDFARVSDDGFYAKRKLLAGYNLSSYQLADETYDPNNQVNMLTDDQGNLVIAGSFSLINSVDRRSLACIDLNTGRPTSWEPNPAGVVNALAIKDSTLFAGGSFYSIGSNYLSRQNIAAINTKTGNALNWSADANDEVLALAVKDSILYIGGHFTEVKGKSRNYAASVLTKNGTVRNWNPLPNFAVTSLLPLNNHIYMGGYFSNIKGVSRNHLAKVDNATGKPAAWNPNADGTVYSIINAGKNIFVSGEFSAIGSNTRMSLAAFDTASGALNAFDAKINNNSYYTYSGIYPLAAYGRSVYFGGGYYFQNVGDSIRGYLAGIDTTTAAALPFNPKPSTYFSATASNALYVGKNKLFTGGNWQYLGTNGKPSYFAVFTLEPQVKSSNLIFSNLQPTSVTIKFKHGDGENRLVVIKQAAIAAAPEDGKGYVANAAFASGDSTGQASYVVYNGTGNSINVSNLLPNQSYTVSVYEYNGNGQSSDYLTYTVLTKTFKTPNLFTKPVADSATTQITTVKATAKAYPNPAQNECTVTFNANSKKNYIIELADAGGRIFLRQAVHASNGFNLVNLNTEDLPSGVYIINIIDENGKRETLKLIRQ